MVQDAKKKDVPRDIKTLYCRHNNIYRTINIKAKVLYDNSIKNIIGTIMLSSFNFSRTFKFMFIIFVSCYNTFISPILLAVYWNFFICIWFHLYSSHYFNLEFCCSSFYVEKAISSRTGRCIHHLFC